MRTERGAERIGSGVRQRFSKTDLRFSEKWTWTQIWYLWYGVYRICKDHVDFSSFAF